jgi:adenylate kinase family enzyme
LVPSLPVLRVSVVGNSGSGKSTLARALAGRLGVPHIELDAIFHQPGWRPLPKDDLRARVDAATVTGGWVVDGNYSAVRDIVWGRADTVVWLDLPRRVVMRQVVWRTVRRMALRAELWNGNRERWRNLLTRDPERSIILWAWRRHSTYRDRYAAAATDPAWSHLTFVRIGSRRDVRHVLNRADTAAR